MGEGEVYKYEQLLCSGKELELAFMRVLRTVWFPLMYTRESGTGAGVEEVQSAVLIKSLIATGLNPLHNWCKLVSKHLFVLMLEDPSSCA